MYVLCTFSWQRNVVFFSKIIFQLVCMCQCATTCTRFFFFWLNSSASTLLFTYHSDEIRYSVWPCYLPYFVKTFLSWLYARLFCNSLFRIYAMLYKTMLFYMYFVYRKLLQIQLGHSIMKVYPHIDILVNFSRQHHTLC